MAPGNSDAVARVKARLNIADVVRRYVPSLRKAGPRWVAPCPFHHETKPSFSVNEEEGFFYCFGCQEKGDVIDFHSKINGLDFKESLSQLAREAGVDLGEYASRQNPQAEDEAKRERDRKRQCLTLHRLASEHYQANLRGEQGGECRDYLVGRGLSSETVAAFGLGWSLPEYGGLREHFQAMRVPLADAVQAGLLKQKDGGNVYDMFRGRLMFPIQDAGGKVLAFGGRILGGDGPKYINSGDTPLYKKGEHLYGLAQARRVIHQTRKALLTEGYLDVITLHQHGVANAVGVLGTALTPEQVDRLGHYASHVELLFDGDAPGRKAALRSAQMLLTKGLGCAVVLLPQGEDADSLLRQEGREALDALRRQAGEGLAFCLEQVAASHAPRDIIQWAKDFLEALDDPAQRAYFLPRIISGLGLEETAFRKALGEFDAATHPRRTSRRGKIVHGQFGRRQFEPWPKADVILPPPETQPTIAISVEEQLLHHVCCFPEDIPRLHQEGAMLMLSSPWTISFWEKLVQAHETGSVADIFPLLESFSGQERTCYAEATRHREGYCANREFQLQMLVETIHDRKLAREGSDHKQLLASNNPEDQFEGLKGLLTLSERRFHGRNDGQ